MPSSCGDQERSFCSILPTNGCKVYFRSGAFFRFVRSGGSELTGLLDVFDNLVQAFGSEHADPWDERCFVEISFRNNHTGCAVRFCK